MSLSPLPSTVRGALLALAALALFAPAGAAQDFEGVGYTPPPLVTFVDSAALVRAVAALPAAELPQGIAPLFWVSYDSNGAVHEVEPIFDKMPTAYAQPVVAAIRAHLKPRTPSKRPLQTHLRVVTGPGARVDRPRLREEQPDLANRGEIARHLSRAMARFAAQRGAMVRSGYQADLKFRVGTDGRADTASVEVVRSTGEPELDREAIAALALMRFRVARIEGVPVRVWVTLPVNFAWEDGAPALPAS
jgi:TonB family protein